MSRVESGSGLNESSVCDEDAERAEKRVIPSLDREQRLPPIPAEFTGRIVGLIVLFLEHPLCLKVGLALPMLDSNCSFWRSACTRQYGHAKGKGKSKKFKTMTAEGWKARYKAIFAKSQKIKMEKEQAEMAHRIRESGLIGEEVLLQDEDQFRAWGYRKSYTEVSHKIKNTKNLRDLNYHHIQAQLPLSPSAMASFDAKSYVVVPDKAPTVDPLMLEQTGQSYRQINHSGRRDVSDGADEKGRRWDRRRCVKFNGKKAFKRTQA
eukprot:jgi/Bigna1/92015/estExt_fgenesh1_pg.C_1700001